MKININKDILQEKLSLVSHFTSSKFSSLTALQGVLIKTEKNAIHLYSTNLSSFCHTTIKQETEGEIKVAIEPRKILEFLSLLPSGKIEIEINPPAGGKEIIIIQGKTKGDFPILVANDEFPLPPKIEGKEQKIKTKKFFEGLSMVSFAASSDETRPVLTGINFLSQEDSNLLVSTDGFRLSLLKIKKDIDISSMIVPSAFLSDLGRLIKDEEISFSYINEEKTIVIKTKEDEFYSRLIEGEYPPFEKVIPSEIKTTIQLDREEFLRNIKLISIFARETSNIILINIGKSGIDIKPKTGSEDKNITYQEGSVTGEDIKIAFNYKFLLDFLNNTNAKRITIETVRPDAPVVFRPDNNKDFLHIIMPVRIQE